MFAAKSKAEYSQKFSIVWISWYQFYWVVSNILYEVLPVCAHCHLDWQIWHWWKICITPRGKRPVRCDWLSPDSSPVVSYEKIGNLRVLLQNLLPILYMEISYYLHVYCLANDTHFHIKGCAPGLIFKQRQKATRKWPFVSGIRSCTSLRKPCLLWNFSNEKAVVTVDY